MKRLGMVLGLALAMLAAGTTAARAQCSLQPSDPNWGIATVFRLQAPPAVGGTIAASQFTINVVDCGARPTLNVNQTTGLQNAITFACNQVTAAGDSGRPTVYIPPGSYSFTTLTIPCSGITLKGGGPANGGATSSGAVLCSSAAASATMLTVGTAARPATKVVVEDILFSGFCGGFPQGIDITCNRCQFNRVGVTGYSVFGYRFLGAASNGSGGFSSLTECEIQNGQANSFAVVVVTQGGGTGGPDGNTIQDCYINTGVGGWINDSTVAGATALRSSQHFIGNRFNGVNAGNIVAIVGAGDLDRYTQNRFENTGAGGIAINVTNTVNSDNPAIFLGNLWACGPALCSWTDNSTNRALRIGETMGPTTTPQPPGLQQTCQSASATVSGAGSPVNLKSCTIQANTVAASSQFLHVRVWGTDANNVNAKTVSVTFGGVTLITITLTTSAVDQWQCDLMIAFRTTGSAAQSVGGECSGNATGTVATPASSSPSLNFTTSNTLAVSVTQVAAGDVTQDGMLVAVCGTMGAGC